MERLNGQPYTAKIDDFPTNGLEGVEDSLAYRINEVERHFHNRERWWGALAAPDETNAIEANVNRPFSADSGANTWGTAISILGTADDPTPGDGDTRFDARELLIVDTQHASAYRLRIIWGTGTSADAITAGQWTEEMFFGTLGAPSGMAVEHRIRRILIGWKMWVQVWNVNNNSTVDFYWGPHGYIA